MRIPRKRDLFNGVFAALFVAMIGHGEAVGQLPGFEIIELTDDEHFNEGCGLNNCGEVTYSKRFGPMLSHEEIFLYDNGKTTEITSNGLFDRFPEINDSGTMVWMRRLGRLESSEEIVLFEQGTETLLTDNEVNDGAPQINNQAHVVWYQSSGAPCSGFELMRYDGSTTTQITDNGFSNQSAQLNDIGDVLWNKFDFCVSPWESEVMVNLGGDIQAITEGLGLLEPSGWDINNLRQVVYQSKDPDTLVRMVHVWEDGVHTLLTDWGRSPEINDLGHIAFGRVESDGVAHAWIYIDGLFTQVTFDEFTSTACALNEWDEMVLSRSNFPTTQKRFMRRIRTGEADFDGHIDLKDAAAFQNCMTGPGDFDGTVGGFDRLCDCRFLDIDHDRDVDRDDYALFATAMTGPE